MTDKINDGGPAFPHPSNSFKGFGLGCGMSLRDYFAAKAMAAWQSNPLPNDSDVKTVADWAYRQADAMLAAREVKHD